MKEVDWSSDLLLSCCWLLLPVMSSNGIQLTTGEGKYVHGRGGWGCNGAACALAHARPDIRYWSPFVRVGTGLWWGLCLHIPYVHDVIFIHVESEWEQRQNPADRILASANMWLLDESLETGQAKKEGKKTQKQGNRRRKKNVSSKNNIHKTLKNNSECLYKHWIWTGTYHHRLTVSIKYDYIFPLFGTAAYVLYVLEMV